MTNLFKKSMAALVIAAQASLIPALPITASAAPAPRCMENLDRGVVAVKTDEGVFISWRRLGTEPASTNFTLYRNDTKVADGAITNFTDKGGTQSDKYTVVTDGKTMSAPTSVLENQWIDIPLADTPDFEGDYTTSRDGVYMPGYTPNDAAYGDLDGDGQYEIVMLWDPGDSKDSSLSGRTGKVYMDAYKLDGTFLWRVDLGYNVTAGAHYTQLCVADFDGDGKSEVVIRTADGTKDAAGNVVGDASMGETYEGSWAAMDNGKNLRGPLYVTAFDGATGTIIDSTDYYVNNKKGSNEVSLSFGDDFGNRSERFNATIAYLDGVHPSAVFSRGYYFGKNISTPNGRTAVAAYSLKNNKLQMDWKYDTSDPGNADGVGQGNHQIEAGDINGDGKDEIFIGAIAWNSDGSVLWNTRQEHGDTLHLGDFDPRLPGLEFMKTYEDYDETSDTFDLNGPILSKFNAAAASDSATLAAGRHIYGGSLQNAATGEYIQLHNGSKDTGRGIIANIGYGNSYYVMWGSASMGYWDSDGNKLPDLGLSMNGRIYWDGDLEDELQDHVGAGQEILVQKWNDSTKKMDTLFTAPYSHSINSTKGNMCAQGDIIGDWREEIVSYVITGEEDSNRQLELTGTWDPETESYRKVTVNASEKKYKYALRIYTTTIPTDYNFYTLAHDGIYRNSSAAYNNEYNQPPHISWYMNDKLGYTTQPDANITLVNNNYKPQSFNESQLPASSSSSSPQSTSVFADCKGHWAEMAVNKMYKEGIIDGISSNVFAPEASITKGQFIKMAVLKSGIAPDSTQSSDWAIPYYNAAVKSGIVTDELGITTDNLSDNINREEMAVIIANAASLLNKSSDKAVSFTDSDSIDSLFIQKVTLAAGLGYINGYDDGTFRPLNGATRAEAATILSRLEN